MIKDACRSFSSDKLKVVSENKREVRFINESKAYLCVIKIDSCQVTDATERCDFLVEIYSKDRERVVKAIFIELKGGDVVKGLSQLRTTLTGFREYFSKQMKEAILVCTRVPTVGTDIQKVKIEFFKKFGCTLIVKNRQLEYPVDLVA